MEPVKLINREILIKKLLETADMAKQAQETSERTEAGEEIKPEKDVMQEENDVAQTDSASWEEKTDKAEMQISDTENDGTSPDISTDKAIAAGDTTAITPVCNLGESIRI